jgi:hypothetical protein
MRLKKLDVAASRNTSHLFLCFSGDPEKVQFERDEGSPTLVQQSQPGVMLIKLSNSSLTFGQDKLGVLQQPWNIFFWHSLIFASKVRSLPRVETVG